MQIKTYLFGAAAFCLLFTAAWVQDPSPSTKQSPTGSMTAGCQQMMEMHRKMQSRMKDMDAELDRMVGEMDRAEGSPKIDAMATLLRRMVEQRKTMRTEMEDMHARMMTHMAGHMEAGGSMTSCPMMGGNTGMHHQRAQPPQKP